MAEEPRHPEAPLPPVAARLMRRARREAESGDMTAAVHTLQNVLALVPSHAEALHQMGVLAYIHEDYAEAVRCFRQALSARPDDVDELVWLGMALFKRHEKPEAADVLQRACRLDPESFEAWYNLGALLRSDARPAEAAAAFERALAIRPAHTDAMLALAGTELTAGRIEAAAALLRGILHREPDNAEVWFALADLKTVRFNEDERRYLERAFSNPSYPVTARVHFGFALARALEDQRDYGRAFDILRAANALQRGLITWDGPRQHRRVEAILRAFDSDPHGPEAPALGHEVIFIACIPRSGSTLVEQILASHPDVEGAGEIDNLRRPIDRESRRRDVSFPLWVPDADERQWQQMGRDYLEATARWRERRPRFTDKSLVNWMLAGAALVMLPAARVVVCRRDPLETCLACYRQLFSEGLEYTFDLDEMADYCVDFMRLTRFWLKKFPGRVFDLEHETLVADPEPAIRRLLDFCGLSFDPACLEPHRNERTVLSAPSAAQVRQPLRRDTARAHLYGDKLDRLRARLRDAGL